jgi:hypothetical protein
LIINCLLKYVFWFYRSTGFYKKEDYAQKLENRKKPSSNGVGGKNQEEFTFSSWKIGKNSSNGCEEKKQEEFTFTWFSSCKTGKKLKKQFKTLFVIIRKEIIMQM